ncbi:hypothetical protein DL96DRAFT_1619880 [Flagelloscypha sp. PMI_526]|nr:hypothetical protein DL96DRAFT_1619880 [Flagelloscypha sp. PMI_526]
MDDYVPDSEDEEMMPLKLPETNIPAPTMTDSISQFPSTPASSRLAATNQVASSVIQTASSSSSTSKKPPPRPRPIPKKPAQSTPYPHTAIAELDDKSSPISEDPFMMSSNPVSASELVKMRRRKASATATPTPAATIDISSDDELSLPLPPKPRPKPKPKAKVSPPIELQPDPEMSSQAQQPPTSPSALSPRFSRKRKDSPITLDSDGGLAVISPSASVVEDLVPLPETIPAYELPPAKKRKTKDDTSMENKKKRKSKDKVQADQAHASKPKRQKDVPVFKSREFIEDSDDEGETGHAVHSNSRDRQESPLTAPPSPASVAAPSPKRPTPVDASDNERSKKRKLMEGKGKGIMRPVVELTARPSMSNKVVLTDDEEALSVPTKQNVARKLVVSDDENDSYNDLPPQPLARKKKQHPLFSDDDDDIAPAVPIKNKKRKERKKKGDDKNTKRGDSRTNVADPILVDELAAPPPVNLSSPSSSPSPAPTTNKKDLDKAVVSDSEEEAEPEKVQDPPAGGSASQPPSPAKENRLPPPRRAESISAKYTVAPRRPSVPMSELIQRAQAKPSSPYPSVSSRMFSSSKRSTSLSTGSASVLYTKNTKTFVSRIAPLHTTRRTPPPAPPPLPPKKKTKKELELEEEWEEELVDELSTEVWCGMTGEEREQKRKDWFRMKRGEWIED